MSTLTERQAQLKAMYDAMGSALISPVTILTQHVQTLRWLGTLSPQEFDGVSIWLRSQYSRDVVDRIEKQTTFVHDVMKRAVELKNAALHSVVKQ
jgi:hypothetical protein